MSRLFRTKARKAGKTCAKCNAWILPGHYYYSWSLGFNLGDVIRCEKHKPEDWETITNATKQDAARAAYELGLAREAEDAETAAEHLDEAMSAAQSAAEQLEEKVSNMESAGTGLDQTELFEQMQSHQQELESWVSDASQALQNLNDADQSTDVLGEDAWKEALDELDDVPEGDW